MRSLVLSVIAFAAFSACSQSGSTVSEASFPKGVDYSDSLAMACSNCHAVQSAGMADVSAMTVSEIESALINYKSQETGTTVMHRLVRGYSEADITAIAETLGRQDD